MSVIAGICRTAAVRASLHPPDRWIGHCNCRPIGASSTFVQSVPGNDLAKTDTFANLVPGNQITKSGGFGSVSRSAKSAQHRTQRKPRRLRGPKRGEEEHRSFHKGIARASLVGELLGLASLRSARPCSGPLRSAAQNAQKGQSFRLGWARLGVTQLSLVSLSGVTGVGEPTKSSIHPAP